MNDFNAFGLEYSIEACAVFAVIVTDEMGERASFAFELPDQLPRLLRYPDLGWGVVPTTCPRRVPTSMKNKTYSVCSASVSTVKKSQASSVSL